MEYAERPWHTKRGYAEVAARVSTAASRCVVLPPGQMRVVLVIAGRACNKGTLRRASRDRRTRQDAFRMVVIHTRMAEPTRRLCTLRIATSKTYVAWMWYRG